MSIDNSAGELRANMTTNAEIVLEEHKQTLVVPEAAVIYDAKRNASVELSCPAPRTGASAARSRSASATARGRRCSAA